MKSEGVTSSTIKVIKWKKTSLNSREFIPKQKAAQYRKEDGQIEPEGVTVRLQWGLNAIVDLVCWLHFATSD